MRIGNPEADTQKVTRCTTPATDMFAVVGCGECHALWIVEGQPERSQCPRCGKTRAWKKRRKFVTTDDENHARDVRATMLAERGGYDEQFADVGSFADLEDAVADAGIDDETYLEAAGVDVSAVEDAADRIESGTSSQSREEVLREAIRTQESPSLADITAYASERGVPAERVEQLVEKLVRAGEVSEHRGQYRLL